RIAASALRPGRGPARARLWFAGNRWFAGLRFRAARRKSAWRFLLAKLRCFRQAEPRAIGSAPAREPRPPTARHGRRHAAARENEASHDGWKDAGPISRRQRRRQRLLLLQTKSTACPRCARRPATTERRRRAQARESVLPRRRA